MLDVNGDGVLALWNGVEPSRREEYDAWHGREHVPERLGVPGMLGARRYVRTQGPLPEYLTLYFMDSTAVLSSAPYRKLLDNPTAWSRAMRPSFRGFMRLACRRLMSLGGSAGGTLLAIVVDETADLRAPAVKSELEKLLAQHAILAAHVIESDKDIADVPFTIGGPALDFPRGGAIFLESYDERDLRSALPAIEAALVRIGVDRPRRTMTGYRLAQALDRGSVARIIPVTRR